MAPVSVVIPCYCCAATVTRAIKSVLAQTCLPGEIILVDDASSDDGRTLGVLRKLAVSPNGRVPIRVIALERNQGPATARNTGWDAAVQPYVAFLDADDAWHPRKIEIQHGWMQAHPNVSICGHGTTVLSDPSRFPELPSTWHGRRIGRILMFLSNRLPLRSIMLRRDLPLHFEPGQFYAEDYLLWMRALLSGHELWYLPLPLGFSFKRDYGTMGLSDRLWSMQKGELKVYHLLYRERLAPTWLLVAAAVFSFLKFLRRSVVSVFRVRQTPI
jgi:glycosyltransferase involved in cell wall biosynthesis